jgi:putative membrane protein
VPGVNSFLQIAPLAAASHWDHHGFWWFPVGLLWLAVLGTIVWLVVHTVRRDNRSGVERATDILAERYARGEVSVEEYRERLGELARHQ